MAKTKGFSVGIDPSSVVYTTISKSNDYSNARVTMKVGEKAYLSVSVEWEGDMIPDFAMQLMDMVKSNNEKANEAWSGMEEDFEFLKTRQIS